MSKEVVSKKKWIRIFIVIITIFIFIAVLIIISTKLDITFLRKQKIIFISYQQNHFIKEMLYIEKNIIETGTVQTHRA